MHHLLERKITYSFKGVIIDISNGISSELSCWQKCVEKDECSWYSYDSKVESCIAFENCPTLDETATDFISGEADCQFQSTSTMTVPSISTATIPTTTSPKKKASMFLQFVVFLG